MEIAVEKLVALCCLGIGLSHIFQARAWVNLFIYALGLLIVYSLVSRAALV